MIPIKVVSGDTTKPRPSYAVTPETHGTDVVADYAAALAASSIAFSSDTAISKYGISYSDELLQHSAQLYEVAKSEDDTSKRQTYQVAEYWSSGYFDELAWAAVWLAYAASTTVSSPTSSPTHSSPSQQSWKESQSNITEASSAIPSSDTGNPNPPCHSIDGSTHSSMGNAPSTNDGSTHVSCEPPGLDISNN